MKASTRAKRGGRAYRPEKTAILMPIRPVYVVDPYFRDRVSTTSTASSPVVKAEPSSAPAEKPSSATSSSQTEPDTPSPKRPADEDGSDGEVDPATGRKHKKTNDAANQKRICRNGSRSKIYRKSNK
eukprot:jgi/Mesvir1/20011/Mv13266-RA.1